MDRHQEETIAPFHGVPALSGKVPYLEAVFTTVARRLVSLFPAIRLKLPPAPTHAEGFFNKLRGTGCTPGPSHMVQQQNGVLRKRFFLTLFLSKKECLPHINFRMVSVAVSGSAEMVMVNLIFSGELKPSSHVRKAPTSRSSLDLATLQRLSIKTWEIS